MRATHAPRPAPPLEGITRARTSASSLLNLGILAHVDAGKTTLTERLLHLAGVIDEPGSVDSGTTRTDSLALERRRGITIKAAVVSFPLDGTTVNVVDTPGHPDFIAEVERVLGVLDGAILVLSAVEGVQPQTRILMRALQRLKVPTLIFVNKVDRTGRGSRQRARGDPPAAHHRHPADGRCRRLGQPVGPFEAFRPEDSRLPRAGRSRRSPSTTTRCWRRTSRAGRSRRPGCGLIAAQARDGRAASGVRRLGGHRRRGRRADGRDRGAAAGDRTPDRSGEPSGRVFKIERGRRARRSPTSGCSPDRSRLRTADWRSRSGRPGKVSGCQLFERRASGCARTPSRRDRSADCTGLGRSRSATGSATPPVPAEHHFPPPTLEASVTAVAREQGPALRRALDQLADQDPLIGVHTGEDGRPTVSLYGRVQQEVLGSTLAEEHGIEVASPTRACCTWSDLAASGGRSSG